MKLLYVTILFCLTINFSLKAQDESSLNKLSKELERLEAIKNDKQQRIIEITNDLQIVSRQNYQQAKEIRKQKTTIENLTEELLILNGEISNIKADYNRLIEEINLLQIQSEESDLMIEKLQNANAELTAQLNQSYMEIGQLTDELKEKGFENEILQAKNDALESMIESLLELRKHIFFLETNFGSPNMFDFTLSYNLLKGKNSLAIGGFVSYKRYSFTLSRSLNQSYDLNALTIGGSFRATVIGGNFGYTYIDPRKSILENMKILGYFNFGYSIPLQSSSESSFNRSNINVSAGSSAIINIPNLATFYFNLGAESQEFRNSENDRNDLGYFFKMGIGVLFSFE